VDPAVIKIKESPAYLRIFDTTTGTEVTPPCDANTCVASVSQGVVGSRTYRAYVSGGGGGYPPPNVLCNSAPVVITWAPFAPTVELQADAPYQLVGGTATLTAKAYNKPSSAVIKIFDTTTGTELDTCPTTTCSTTVTKNQAIKRTYRAYVSESGSGETDATSAALDVTWSSSIVLNVEKTVLYPGEQATLTAKSSATSGQSAFIQIYDVETGQLVKVCTHITICTSPPVSGQGSPRTFIAVEQWWPNAPWSPPQLSRASNQVSVNWLSKPT
jgi:hypothetical protein